MESLVDPDLRFVSTRQVGSESLLDVSDHIRAPMDLGHSWLMSLMVSSMSSGARWMAMTWNLAGSVDMPYKFAMIFVRHKTRNRKGQDGQELMHFQSHHD